MSLQYAFNLSIILAERNKLNPHMQSRKSTFRAILQTCLGERGNKTRIKTHLILALLNSTKLSTELKMGCWLNSYKWSRETSMATLWRSSGWLWCSVSCADPWEEWPSSAWLRPPSTTSWHGGCCYSNRRDSVLKLCGSASAPWRTVNWAPFHHDRLTCDGENGKFLNGVNHTHNGWITGETRNQNLLICLSGFMVEGGAAVFGKDTGKLITYKTKHHRCVKYIHTY